MAKNPDLHLSRRERQIMAVLFRTGGASVAEIAAGMPDPPSDTAVRTLLGILEEKGHARSQKDGRRNLWRAKMSRTKAARGALADVLGTFFDGSLREAVATHLSDPTAKLGAEELERLQALIDEARRERK